MFNGLLYQLVFTIKDLINCSNFTVFQTYDCFKKLLFTMVDKRFSELVDDNNLQKTITRGFLRADTFYAGSYKYFCQYIKLLLDFSRNVPLILRPYTNIEYIVFAKYIFLKFGIIYAKHIASVHQSCLIKRSGSNLYLYSGYLHDTM